ncbi:MAG: Lrp/AsnC family transcriptional regulator [Pikeienuella sp.]
MDDIDNKLIALLRRNARASVSELAANLGVTRATVRARMDRLTAEGEVIGYTAVLRGDAEDAPVRGVMLIEIEGKGSDRIIRRLSGMPEVRTIHTTNGRWDVVIELSADTLPALDQVLRTIRQIDGVQNSETSLYLTTRRSDARFVRAG